MCLVCNRPEVPYWTFQSQHIRFFVCGPASSNVINKFEKLLYLGLSALECTARYFSKTVYILTCNFFLLCLVKLPVHSSASNLSPCLPHDILILACVTVSCVLLPLSCSESELGVTDLSEAVTVAMEDSDRQPLKPGRPRFENIKWNVGIG